VDLGEAGCEDAKMRSRKITDFFNPKLTAKKMSKQEIVEKNFREVISSEEGLEKSHDTICRLCNDPYLSFAEVS
jgi:hypothetical protein